MISGALLYLALRKVDLSKLFSRFTLTSLFWIDMAIAVKFLQIFVGVLRWREINAECGAPARIGRAMRYNVIGTFFNPAFRDRRRRRVARRARGVAVGRPASDCSPSSTAQGRSASGSAPWGASIELADGAHHQRDAWSRDRDLNGGCALVAAVFSDDNQGEFVCPREIRLGEIAEPRPDHDKLAALGLFYNRDTVDLHRRPAQALNTIRPSGDCHRPFHSVARKLVRLIIAQAIRCGFGFRR